MRIPGQIAVLLLACFNFVPASQGQTWENRSTDFSYRWNPGCTYYDGRLYMIGGQEPGEDYPSVATVEAYNPATDTWKVRASMLTRRWGLVAVTVGDYIYAIGGQGGRWKSEEGFYGLTTVERYDPAANTWTSLASMSVPRGWCCGAAVNGAIHIFGGQDGSETSNVTIHEVYYPSSDTWVRLPDIPEYISMSMAAAVGTNIYIIGGMFNSNLTLEYNTQTGAWLQKADMPTHRMLSGIAVYDGKIYVIGGRLGNSNGITNALECYDPATDTWTTLNPMQTPREGLVAGAVDGTLYAIGGTSYTPGLKYNEEASNITDVPSGPSRGPAAFALEGNYPNPFNPVTEIVFCIPESGRVHLSVFNALGQNVDEVIDSRFPAGSHTARFSGGDLPGGVYFYTLTWNGITRTGKMVLLK